MSLERLRRRWEERATEDPRYYIKADRRDWTDQDFLASGEHDVAREVDPFLEQLGSRASALDVRCGLGRLTRALANRFDKVDGVDISREMIEQARRFAPPVPTKVSFRVCDGTGAIPLPTATVDFAFSYLVFQHLPRTSLVTAYLREIGRVLHPGGLARVQVNGQGRGVRERLTVGVVDSERIPVIHRKPRMKLDPPSHMGVVVSDRQCKRLAAKAGLAVEQLHGAGTSETWLTLRRPGGPPR